MARILKDRSDLMIRNLGKGVKRKDMNINTVEYWILKLKKNFDKIGKAFDSTKTRVKRKIKKVFQPAPRVIRRKRTEDNIKNDY